MMRVPGNGKSYWNRSRSTSLRYRWPGNLPVAIILMVVLGFPGCSGGDRKEEDVSDDAALVSRPDVSEAVSSPDPKVPRPEEGPDSEGEATVLDLPIAPIVHGKARSAPRSDAGISPGWSSSY